ncbi:MAG: endonuclease V [Planctomycetes bacterium]|nr:endonuclease V [Planctomycetota bacterium]
MTVAIPDLPACLFDLLAQIPAGKVTTYGALATALGHPPAARFVGEFALDHEHHAGCRCHRVVRADGAPGQYIAGTPEEKLRRLSDEGVRVTDRGVDLAASGFDAFVCDQPLAALRRQQEAVAGQLSLRGRGRLPKLVGGVDVSYRGGREGVAAYALVDVATGKLVWSLTIARPVTFPYIPSFLTFREMPILLALLNEVRAAGRLTDVVLVDGTGILHPRRIGITAHLGIVAGQPTMGVTKSLLCGEYNENELTFETPQPILLDGEVLGTAILPHRRSSKPLFVSPGNLVDVEFSAQLVRALLTGRPLPEPIYWADRLSRQVARGRVPAGQASGTTGG